MVIGYFDIICIAVNEPEAYAPLVVNRYCMLPASVILQRVKAVAWWRFKILNTRCKVNIFESAYSSSEKIRFKPSRFPHEGAEDGFDADLLERDIVDLRKLGEHLQLRARNHGYIRARDRDQSACRGPAHITLDEFSGNLFLFSHDGSLPMPPVQDAEAMHTRSVRYVPAEMRNPHQYEVCQITTIGRAVKHQDFQRISQALQQSFQG